VAIPRSKLSDLLGLCSTPGEMLARLREEALLSPTASEDHILRVIREGLKEEADELAEQGFTWATADARIAWKLAAGGYLSKKGRRWAKPGGGILRRLVMRVERE